MRFHFENLFFSAINNKSDRAIQRPVRFAGIGVLTIAPADCRAEARILEFCALSEIQ